MRVLLKVTHSLGARAAVGERAPPALQHERAPRNKGGGATKGEGLPRGGAAPSRWTTWIRGAADAARGVANLRAWWTGGGEETS